MPKKADIILIVCLVVLAVFTALFFITAENGKSVTVSINNKEVETLSLFKNIEKEYKTEHGLNTLVIENGKAFIKKADCKDKLCQNKGKISKKGEIIVCAPHKFLAEVK